MRFSYSLSSRGAVVILSEPSPASGTFPVILSEPSPASGTFPVILSEPSLASGERRILPCSRVRSFGGFAASE